MEQSGQLNGAVGAAGKERRTREHGNEGVPGARLLAHLALQIEARVAVGEVLPEQQSVFILLPSQAVTVIVEVKGLPPVGARAGVSEQSGSRGPGRGLPGSCPKAQEQWPEGTRTFSMGRSSSNAQCIYV